jgi:hypothetical protein
MKLHIFFKVVFLSLLTRQALAIPKYGPNAIPLSKKTNLEYFSKGDGKALDFWHLMPFYQAQPNDRACSATSFLMVLNGMRADMDLNSKDELITFKSLLEKYTDDRYKKVMIGEKSPLSFKRDDIKNTRLADVLTIAMKKTKIWTPDSLVENHVIDQKKLEVSRHEFHEALLKNEKSDQDFMIIIFVQGMLTGDPEGMLAHVAPIGGYDEKKHLVLIMDPDRQWYEPYWSPEDKVFDAIADPRSDVEPSWLYAKIK